MRGTLRLPDVGLAGQRRLEAARVLLVGAGLWLAGGVLPGRGWRRQPAHRRRRHRRPRQPAAADPAHRARRVRPRSIRQAVALAALNPRTQHRSGGGTRPRQAVERLLAGVDVVVDGADNFPARYLLNDACVKLGIPVYGAVHRFRRPGQRVRRRPPARRGALLPLPVPRPAQRGGCV